MIQDLKLNLLNKNMIQYNFDRKSVDISYLSKESIKDIDKQLNEVESQYGGMDISILGEDRLHYGCNPIKINGIKYYNPFVSVWDYIKEDDDVLFVELNLNNITDKKTALSYAKEIIKYIKCRILNSEIERL